MSYEFQGLLYGTATEVMDKVARCWVIGDGTNSEQDVALILKEFSDAQMAKDCIKNWELQEWLESNDLDHDDLVRAFARLANAILN